MEKKKDYHNKERGLSIYLPLDVVRWLRETAKKQERSASNYISYVLRKEMEADQNK